MIRIRTVATIAACVLSGVALAVPGREASGADPRLLRQGDLRAPPPEGAFKRPKYDKPMRDGELVRGSRNIAAAWFSDPVSRYRNSPFGSEQHPTTLTVSTAERRVLRLVLPADSVFEDRVPRLFDLDGDGAEDVIVVRSYMFKGSALAVASVRGAALEITAETPPIGSPFRWLNPAGFGDFDGDGKPDVALVVTPHTEGELQFWTLKDGTFELIDTADDVSNHARGSRHMGLSAVADFNGDGIVDLAIPSQDRLRVRFLTLAGGRLDELGDWLLPAPAAEDFQIVQVAGKTGVRVGLAGGRSLTVVPCRDIDGWRMVNGQC